MSTSTDELELAIVRVIKELIKLKRENRKVAKKKLWVKTWILRRNQLGASNTLLRELALEDQQSYFNFLRINESMFNILLQKVITYYCISIYSIINNVFYCIYQKS